ncbi:MAG: hypothetical protein Q4C70_15785, partial [Planctomycetia bacterium]|nr:hypothetical protein [Planctomycetia bacterium]
MYRFALISFILLMWLLMGTFSAVSLYAEEGNAERKHLLPADVTQMDLDYILDELGAVHTNPLKKSKLIANN